jgi:hypothetical protein
MRRSSLNLSKLLQGRLSNDPVAVTKELVVTLWEWETGDLDTADWEYAAYVQKREFGPTTPV